MGFCVFHWSSVTVAGLLSMFAMRPFDDFLGQVEKFRRTIVHLHGESDDRSECADILWIRIDQLTRCTDQTGNVLRSLISLNEQAGTNFLELRTRILFLPLV